MLIILMLRAYVVVYMLGAAAVVTIVILMPKAKPIQPTFFERWLAIVFVISFVISIITFQHGYE
jgi:hypothetical protein